MIDLQTVYMRAYLRELERRVAITSDALAWYEGDPELVADDLVPAFQEGTAAEADFLRFATQVVSDGPLALRLRRQAMLGTVTWSRTTADIDRQLGDLRLRRLAEQGAKSLVVNGVCAYWPVMREAVRSAGDDDEQPVADPGTPTLQHLGGHLELLWADDDVGGMPVGLLQVTGNQTLHEGAGVRYDVRIWDFTDRQLRVWLNLQKPWQIGDDPTHVYPRDGDGSGDLIMPTVEWTDTDQYGHPVGEGRTNLPLLRQEVATTMRIMRASQSHAFPVWALQGDWQLVQNIGTNTVLRARSAGSTAERIGGGDMEQLFLERRELRERVRTQHMLPLTGSQDAPSGEAYVQANVAYYTVSDDYALHLSQALTPAVRGYLALLRGTTDTSAADLQALEITVKPDMELKRSTISMQVREDFRAGLVSLEMAMAELEAYYPGTDPQMLRRWLDAHALDSAIDDDDSLPDPARFAQTDDDRDSTT